jgi:hypothetical protein
MLDKDDVVGVIDLTVTVVVGAAVSKPRPHWARNARAKYSPIGDINAAITCNVTRRLDRAWAHTAYVTTPVFASNSSLLAYAVGSAVKLLDTSVPGAVATEIDLNTSLSREAPDTVYQITLDADAGFLGVTMRPSFSTYRLYVLRVQGTAVSAPISLWETSEYSPSLISFQP